MLFLNRKTPHHGQGLLGAASMQGSTAWTDDSYRPSSALLHEERASAAKRACGSIECESTRISPWRNRRRPIFEDRWACSGRCILSMVRAAVRRESVEPDAAHPVLHRHRVPLGLVLLAQGWITHAQLQQALEAQRARGGRIGDCLVQECGVEPAQITRGLSMQWSCPVLTASGFTPRAMAMIVPPVFIEEFGLLPLRVAGLRLLYLGFEERLDASAALALEQMTELKVESGLVPAEEYTSARQNLLEYEGVPVKTEHADEPDALAARITAILEQKQPVASKLVRMHQYLWLRLWLEEGARKGTGALPHNREDMMDYIFTIGARS
ncbi:MAG: hypothetical protein JSS95_03435 [Acidobacteria bacterium]|nr:hypothetical protein [Acidobacteriota bacterium]